MISTTLDINSFLAPPMIMQPFTRLASVVIAATLIGCSAQDAPPGGSRSAASTLTEGDVQNIAEKAAERVVLRVQVEEQTRRKQAAEDEARLARKVASTAEQNRGADAARLSEEAYLLLVPSERARVEAIRERLAQEGLHRLEPEDLQWAWQGDGQACLRGELLTAAAQHLPKVEADTALLRLSPAGLIEFFCLDSLEQLRRLQLAKRFHEGDPSISDDTIIEFRYDPFLGKLVADYMKLRYPLPEPETTQEP